MESKLSAGVRLIKCDRVYNPLTFWFHPQDKNKLISLIDGDQNVKTCPICEYYEQSKNMNRSEALDAMKNGFKVRHKYFSPDEWMCEKNGRYEFEDGNRCDFERFWFTRMDDVWKTGWSVVD